MVMAPIDRKFPPLRPVLVTPDTAVDNATFDLLDGNGDDSVGKDEWQAAGWTADRFKAFDGNRDGKVSRTEFQDGRRFEREFNKKDWNQDGELSRGELQGFMKLATASVGKLKDVTGGAAEAMLKCIPGGPALWDRFSRFDTDKSGGVSKEEYIKGRRSEARPVIWDGLKPLKPSFDHKDILMASAKPAKKD